MHKIVIHYKKSQVRYRTAARVEIELMKKIEVKVCGLKREKDLKICMSMGVDILGFVVEYPLPVPWNMSSADALPLLKLVNNSNNSPYNHRHFEQGLQPKGFTDGLTEGLNNDFTEGFTKTLSRSCIVTGGSPGKVIELAQILKPSMVQLHYRETLSDTIIITEKLRKENIDVIKTIPPSIEERIYQFGTADIEVIVRLLCDTGVYALLVDSRTPSNAANSSSQLDMDFCSQIVRLSSKPVIIAGGINADNVCAILSLTGAEYIDIMTGVEKSPGEKDKGLLADLMNAIIYY